MEGLHGISTFGVCGQPFKTKQMSDTSLYCITEQAEWHGAVVERKSCMLGSRFDS